MYGRTIYADQKLIINQQAISGVTNFNGSFDIPYENIDVLGGNLATSVQGESARNISFNRFLIQADPLKYLTGNFSCNGFVSYQNKSFGFRSGYMTNYSASCSVGDIAEITTDFIVYENIGGGVEEAILPSQNTDNIYVANAGSIIINANEGSTNRIMSFEYSVNCERIPLFVLGSRDPSDVILKKPIIAELTLTLEIDDYESSNIQTLLCTPNTQNLQIDLKNCNQTTVIESFLMPNARLISTNYSSSIDDYATVEMLFRSFLV